MIGTYYELRESNAHIYKCQNVELVTMSGTNEVIGQYCLRGIE